MTYQRLAYDDQDTAGRMTDDCVACTSRLHLPAQRPDRRLDATDLAAKAPSLAWEEFPEQTAKRGIEVSEAAAHLASRLHLHLD